VQAHVWIVADDEGGKYVLCDDHPMPPVNVLELVGSFDIPDFGWGQAREVAEAKGKELGVRVEFYSDLFA